MYAQSRPNSFYGAEGDYLQDPPRRPRQARLSKSPRPLPADPPYEAYDPDDAPIDGTADEFYAQQQQQPYPEQIPQYPRRSQSIRDHSPPPPPQSGPLLDHSHLRPGNQASLLSHERTLELYRTNAKKSQDPATQFEFAVFMIDASKSYHIPAPTPANVIEVEKAIEKRDNMIHEAIALLKRLADRGHPESQYFLADCFANGIGTYKGRQDFDRAYPLFVLAAKHGHPDAAYRAGTCCENGWGCRREAAKALQFFRKAGAALHPGAMYRLGLAELNGELGLSKRPREGVKWLKRSAEHATAEFPHGLHELSLIHEKGIYNVVFVDAEYAVELLAQAAELGYAPSAYRLGEFYEYGKLGCPQDPALSIHYYVSSCLQCIHGLMCLDRTSLHSRATVTPALHSQRGIWSAQQAYFLSPTQRRSCGRRKPQRVVSQRQCMRWDTFLKWESAHPQIPNSAYKVAQLKRGH